MNSEKIYVLCPLNIKTGGTELLHQLVDYLLNNYFNASIVYVGDKKEFREIEEFKKYKSNYIFEDEVDSRFNGIIVIPEVYTYKIKKYINARKYMWWLSVDNYSLLFDHKKALKFKGIKYFIKTRLANMLKKIIKRSNTQLPVFKIDNFIDKHLVQSEYARDYLLDQKVSKQKIYDLSDYINDEYFNYTNLEKKDVILYNPKKGTKFTKKIIEADRKHNYYPLINLKNNEVHQKLLESKLYIDFGNHPGKDRFPREAAISRCCIITSKNGSANYKKDVNIPDCYKFDDKRKNIPYIINKINDILVNYDVFINDFEEYRNNIKQEKELFFKQIDLIFGVKSDED